MINHELFNVLITLPHIAGRIQKIPRAAVSPIAAGYCFLSKGFAYEFYQTDKYRQLVSWFWVEPGFVIPTSPYSNVVFSIDAEILEFDYNVTFRHLRGDEESRTDYAFQRAEHNLQIAERISDLQYLSPFQNYMKLQQWMPTVFDHASMEQIASFLNITVIELRRFVLKCPVSMQMLTRYSTIQKT